MLACLRWVRARRQPVRVLTCIAAPATRRGATAAALRRAWPTQHTHSSKEQTQRTYEGGRGDAQRAALRQCRAHEVCRSVFVRPYPTQAHSSGCGGHVSAGRGPRSVPHCGGAVRVDGEPFCEPECTCGLRFCFNCTEEPHSPCTCDMCARAHPFEISRASCVTDVTPVVRAPRRPRCLDAAWHSPARVQHQAPCFHAVCPARTRWPSAVGRVTGAGRPRPSVPLCLHGAWCVQRPSGRVTLHLAPR